MARLFGKNSKRFVVTILLCVVVMWSAGVSERKKEVYAQPCSASIVMNAGDLSIIKGRNYHERMPMASTTKIMTALIVCENCDMSEVVRIPKEGTNIEGSSLYLKEGELMTVGDLLYGLMLRSGNDCAVTLALHTAGTVDNFVAMMNMRAESMGLHNTRFCNPHGLHDENHYTSCYDLCKLSCLAMRNELFRKIVGTKNTCVGQGESKRNITNKNKILFQYEGGTGIKTGYTNAAGRCLVSAAQREGVQVVACVLNEPDMFGVCMNLMDYAFATLQK